MIMTNAIRTKKNFLDAFITFNKVIQKREFKRGAYIGISLGEYSEAILNQTSVQTLYLVDSYHHIGLYKCPMNLEEDDSGLLYKKINGGISESQNRFKLIPEDFDTAINQIDESLDFVYIDADRSYNGVWEVLCAWFKKLKVGGIIGGHNYKHPAFPGVHEAIDQFFNRFTWKINEEAEGLWWVEKKTLSLSFFIPAYNCAKTISESVYSILNQNIEEDDELIIVDDGSTDDTIEVINALSREYKNIKIIQHIRNRGGAAARNTACTNSKMELLFCLDSDNILAPGSIKALKDFLVNNGADVAAFQEVWYFTEDTSVITHKWVFKDSPSSIADYLSIYNVPGASGNYLFTKDSWFRAGGYPEFAGALDTWGFGFRQLSVGQLVLTMSNSGYFHRQGYDSYWIRDFKKGKTSLIALQIILPYLHLLDDSDVEYIMSKNGRHKWFNDIPLRPVRINKSIQGRTDLLHFSENYWEEYMKRTESALWKKLRSLKRRIHNGLKMRL